ncbi:MAG: type II toxin-antitoxin system VapC family toxin [Chloroflexi bacterium]|nr:type II toxin-antitoxin system VapC family toxin [Chloroflexota bacterium]
MILVDTSVWIDHLHRADPRLVGHLERDEIASHPLVIEELGLGSIADRATVLGLLGDLALLPVASHVEVRALVEAHRLWGRGLGAVDVHLLASVRIMPGASLWTRDKRLRAAGAAIDTLLVPWS